MLLFLFGKDVFRSGEKIKEIKEKFLLQNSSGSGLSVLDYEEKETESFAQALGSSGLFSTKQLVIVANCISDAENETQKEILKILEQKINLISDKDLVVVFWEKNEPRKNNTLFKFLSAKAKKQAFIPLEGKALTDWILQRLKKISPATTIESTALSLLCAYTNNELFFLENELAKLAAFKPQGVIEKKDVLLLVKSQANLTIFDIIEAMTGGNKKRALLFLHQQLAQGEDPFYILSMYVYQLRNLLKISSAHAQGNTNQYAIAKEIGLHPFVVQKGLAQIKNIPLKKLIWMYGEIQKIDQAAKTGKSNLILSLDTFITSL